MLHKHGKQQPQVAIAEKAEKFEEKFCMQNNSKIQLLTSCILLFNIKHSKEVSAMFLTLVLNYSKVSMKFKQCVEMKILVEQT